jgi:Mg-chelatase subunit ChlI
MPDMPELAFTDISKFRKGGVVPAFPLVGIVGQQSMKRALMLLASNPELGALLLMGEAGTGKATAARGLGAILPDIEVVKGCVYNCAPDDDEGACLKCRSAKVKEPAMARIPLESLPLGASEKRIFGGFDHNGIFKPGIVGRVNRGYLLVEKANIVEPAILSKLMDVSEAGVYGHSEGGRDYAHPARFSIVATTNPEDGELDPELLARFSLIVCVEAIRDIEERIEIVRRVEAYKSDPQDFFNRSQREAQAFRERVTKARSLAPRADVPSKVLRTIEKVSKETGHDGERVREALRQAAVANASFNDRIWVTVDDVAEVADMVLAMRAGSKD